VLSGVIDGGGGVNALDYSTQTINITVNLATGTATRTGGVTNIRNVATGSGKDSITGNALDNLIQAGTGNDTINGGTGGNDILVGGAGDDTITAGSGRSILIGSAGADILNGGSEQDLLIGDSTSYDNNVAALYALMAEWKRTDIGYAERINHLRGSTAGGLNGSTLLTAAAIQDDNKTDQIFGSGSLDWFWGDVEEEIQSPLAGEVIN
jgi:Ca2+-binding RTX toxin-like protein